MNKKLLRKVASWLESGAPHVGRIGSFNMSRTIAAATVEGCGTTCCIAGAAIQFDLEDRGLPMVNSAWDMCDVDERSFSEIALGACQLDETRGMRLFYPEEYYTWIMYNDIGPAWAARTIRHLLKTGAVDWKETQVAS